MWKLIDSEVLLEQLKIGHLISDGSAQESGFWITQIKENGIITAAKTDVRNFMIIFPKWDLVDARWWLNENGKED